MKISEINFFNIGIQEKVQKIWFYDLIKPGGGVIWQNKITSFIIK